MTDLADRLTDIEIATPSVSEIKDKKLANKMTLTVPEACEALSLSRASKVTQKVIDNYQKPGLYEYRGKRKILMKMNG